MFVRRAIQGGIGRNLVKQQELAFQLQGLGMARIVGTRRQAIVTQAIDLGKVVLQRKIVLRVAK